MWRRGDDDRVMNACFDAKLLHIACKTIAYCVNSYVLLYFKLYGSCGPKLRMQVGLNSANRVLNMKDLALSLQN
jgi:hypothetical protein